MLSALSLLTPFIAEGANTVSVDATALPLVINADTNTLQIEVLAGTEITVLTSPTVVGGYNQFQGLVPILTDSVSMQITGRNFDPNNPNDPNIDNQQTTPTVQLDVIYTETQGALLIGPPSGISVYREANSCEIEWSIPSYPGFLGVRVQYSTDASGITVPYTQLGTTINDVTRTADLPVGATTTSIVNTPSSGTPGYDFSNVTTTRANTKTTNFSSITIAESTVNAELFYVLLTNVIQDPNTNVVYESQAAGPITCGFVNLTKVKPTDFLALQSTTDIASRMIGNVTQRLPSLDLTARAEVRDVIINPLALELSQMSAREWFSHIFRSISALSTLDDADGDGVSDPVETSTIKQQVSQAYGLSYADTQTFIDSRFDVLGESAGLTRGGATTAVTQATFYTYNKPTANIVVGLGAVISTIPDSSSTDTVSFTTTTSAVLDASNLSSFYDPVNLWWAVTVAIQCNTAGANGNVGAGTIQQAVSGTPSGVAVKNLSPAINGTDQQSNAEYAALIQIRLVTGVDSGTKNGLYIAARKVPGVVDAIVIPAGNTDMLRDWDPIRQKHVFGCVDIYVQGDNSSQQVNAVPFSYPSTSQYGVFPTYLALSLIDSVNTRFKITGFGSQSQPLYTAVEVAAVNSGVVVYFGSTRAQFDNTSGVISLDPNEKVYQRNADGSTSIWQVNGVDSTNRSFIQALQQSNAAFYLMAREQVGIQYVPPLQPLESITSIIGPVSGTLASNVIQLVKTNDFLLTGGSNDAGDEIVVAAKDSAPKTISLTLNGSDMLIDSGMDLAIDAIGAPGNVLSVLSQDLSTLYEFGLDYTIVPYGRYHAYALRILPDNTTGNPRIPTGNQVTVSYNKYTLNEALTPVNDTITLNSNLSETLSTPGFVQNVWLPESYGNTTLSLDSGLIAAGVAWSDRYIKATYTSGGSITTLVAGQDYTFTLDPTTLLGSIARVIGGRIPDGASISVQYFTTEVFEVISNYPAYVEQVAAAIAQTQHACSNILVKAMVGSPVDLTFTVNLDSATSPTTADGPIRTATSVLLYGSGTSCKMSKVVETVMQVPGVESVNLPLQKMAKSDGSYSIGEVIPTGTAWVPLATDTAFSTTQVPPSTFITAAPILQNSTIPSGGQPDAYVGLLYENEVYTRTSSVSAFLASTAPSFYIIGTNDYLNPTTPFDSTYAGRVLVKTPANLTTPALNAYRITYQVYGEAGAKNIAVASTEYLVPGTITIIYAGS